jgi:hypothetical protein
VRPRDLTNPSREGKQFVKTILGHYVKGLINDGDYERVELELLDVIRAERGLVLRARGIRRRDLEAL